MPFAKIKSFLNSLSSVKNKIGIIIIFCYIFNIFLREIQICRFLKQVSIAVTAPFILIS